MAWQREHNTPTNPPRPGKAVVSDTCGRKYAYTGSRRFLPKPHMIFLGRRA